MLLLVLRALPADAQIFESVGTRAQGMGGAFVAVADDATATWWNPAGLATGSFFSLIVERGQLTEPGDPLEPGPAWRNSSSGYAFNVPSLGLSLYRLRVSEMRPASPTVGDEPDRQDPGAIQADLRTMTARQLGITVGQSLGSNLVIGSTLKLMTAGWGVSNGVTGASLLDRADDLDASTETHADLDIGAMLATPGARAGVTVKHVREPEFGEGDLRFKLERQVRAGVAVFAGSRRGVQHLTLAFDADLTKTRTATGEAQHVAAGVEGAFFANRLALRGGLSRNVAEPSGTSASAGLTFATRSGLSLDGAYTFGSDRSRAGWNLAVRATLY